MSKYEFLSIIINSIMAFTSVISCIISIKEKKETQSIKKETLSLKKEIEIMINNLKVELNSHDSKINNSGINTGIMAGHFSGGVNIGSKK